MVKRRVAGAALALMVAGTVSAQTPRPTEDEQIRARRRIATMEAILERAVSIGADNLLRQVSSLMPDRPMLSGVPQVRGIPLDHYGVVFYVQVPGLQMPIMWSMRHLIQTPDPRDASLMVQELARHVSQVEGREGENLRNTVRQLQAQLGAIAPRAADVGRGGVSAAALVADTAPAPQAVDPDVVENPHAAYTREVKNALIDAMLENSQALAIGPDEWVTLAARDDEPRNPLVPGDTVAFSTWIASVRGADLAALRSGAITLEDARARVEVREE
jgi:hypothetical protein